jgi:hypothetical protein
MTRTDLSAAICAAVCFTATATGADTFDVKPKIKIVRPPAQTAASKPSASNSSNTITLKVGEIRPVFVTNSYLRPQLAFYLPPEGVPFVQLIVEKRGSQVTYFAKGMRKGRTVGGSVERDWLDFAGFSPASLPAESRIQQALKINPLFLTVE